MNNLVYANFHEKNMIQEFEKYEYDDGFVISALENVTFHINDGIRKFSFAISELLP